MSEINFAWLKQADELRHKDPDAVLRMLLPRASEVKPRFHPMYLGVCGSAFRKRSGKGDCRADLRTAGDYIRMGQHIAWRRGNALAEADLLIRQSYVFGDQGNYTAALRVAERSNALADRGQDKTLRGRSQVEQGRYLYYLNRFSEAEACYDIALKLLPDSEQRYRCATYHALGYCSLELGDPVTAIEYAKLAELLAPDDRSSRAKLMWFRASTLLTLERFEEAEELLTSVLNSLRSIHFGEAALASCDLVKVQILQGKLEEAWSTASSVRSLLIPVSQNELVSAGLAELLRGGRAALDLRTVSRIRSKIDEAREHRLWHSLAAGRS